VYEAISKLKLKNNNLLPRTFMKSARSIPATMVFSTRLYPEFSGNKVQKLRIFMAAAMRNAMHAFLSYGSMRITLCIVCVSWLSEATHFLLAQGVALPIFQSLGNTTHFQNAKRNPASDHVGPKGTCVTRPPTIAGQVSHAQSSHSMIWLYEDARS